MRTTVGPLPATVYWRRRAVVLVAALIAALIVFVSCRGGDDTSKHPGASGPTPTTTASPSPSASPGTEPSFEDATPGGGPALPNPGQVGGDDEVGGGSSTDGGASDGASSGSTSSGQADPGSSPPAGSGVNVAANAGNLCTDAEMTVIPVPASPTVRRGAPINIGLKIKNVSARSCARDVGADLQEIYIKQGAHKTWSSDTCGTARGSELVIFPPGHEAQYGVTWNGLEANRCAAGLAVGAPPAPGDYDIFGRLGAKVSAPVRLTVSN